MLTPITTRRGSRAVGRSLPAASAPLLLFGEPGRNEISEDEKGHMAYAHHICAEIEVTDLVRGVIKWSWKTKSDTNEWLNASYLADVAAAWSGVALYGSLVRRTLGRDEFPELTRISDRREAIADSLSKDGITLEEIRELFVDRLCA